MNNIKKTVTGMLIAAMAFGISAFTTIKNKTIVKYYKTNMSNPAANDPRGYQYFSGDRCEAGGTLCSAQWEIGTNPVPVTDGDMLPLTGVIFQTNTSGHFE